MKKKFVVILAIIILICICACSHKSENEETIFSADSIKESTITSKKITKKESVTQESKGCNIYDENIKWTGMDMKKILFLEEIDINSLPSDIEQKSIEVLNAEGLGCTKLSQIKTALYDMNQDGEEDYFVLPFPDKYAGNSLPPLYLFLSENGSYKIVNTSLKTDTAIKILKSTTNGCFDIQWDLFGNVLNYDGSNSYWGQQDYAISVSLFPIIENDSAVCLKVMIPYGMPDFENYKLVASLFYNDCNNSLIVTSNDESYHDRIYTASSENLIYYFYIDRSEWKQELLSDMYIELKYVEILEP